MENPTFKRDVYDSLVHAIIQLGKNDPEGCKRKLREAGERLDKWLVDRPEKKALEEGKSSKTISEADDYCEACGKEVANRECGHGILCDKCDEQVHGKKDGKCDVI